MIVEIEGKIEELVPFSEIMQERFLSSARRAYYRLQDLPLEHGMVKRDYYTYDNFEMSSKVVGLSYFALEQW